MTDEMMSLCALVEKTSGADLLREMMGFAAERVMELEVGGLTGAGFGENSADRQLAPATTRSGLNHISLKPPRLSSRPARASRRMTSSAEAA